MRATAAIRLMYIVSACGPLLIVVGYIVLLSSTLWVETFTVAIPPLQSIWDNNPSVVTTTIESSVHHYCLLRHGETLCDKTYESTYVLRWRFNETRDGFYIKGEDGTFYPPTPVYVGTSSKVIGAVTVLTVLSIVTMCLQPVAVLVLCIDVRETMPAFWIIVLFAVQTWMMLAPWLLMILSSVRVVGQNDKFTLCDGCEVYDHDVGITLRAKLLTPMFVAINAMSTYMFYVTAAFHRGYKAKRTPRRYSFSEYGGSY